MKRPNVMKHLRSRALRAITLGLALFIVACQGAGDPTTDSGTDEATTSLTDVNVPTEDITDPTDDDVPTEDATEPGSQDPEGIENLNLELEPVFADQSFSRPLLLTHAPGEADLVYVVENEGRVLVLDLSNETGEAEVFLDITDRVNNSANEQGLLGLAFHPDFTNNSLVFVNYTDADGTVVSSFFANSRIQADADRETEILRFDQPYDNHNGGHLAFGPDGYLYIASGDGGSGGDPENYAQGLDTLLGKLLRIDVDGSDGDRQYGVPADNPFSGVSERAEIYAYGLRNPWRFSFDPDGRLWLADVGQNSIEEINIVEAGGNYGWNLREGSLPFREGVADSELIDPIWEYSHDLGRSITGGYVYRGDAVPELQGYYVYGDFISGRIWALQYQGDGRVDNFDLLQSDLSIASFSEDAAGELYVVDYQGAIYRLQN